MAVMGLQLIFVLETNNKCKSDWIYISETISRFYELGEVKISKVYMDGKGKYAKKEKEIRSFISQYKAASRQNRSEVIYCFDCDDYDVNRADLDFLNTVKKYCEDKGYRFVWFCKDIEQVYIGKKVSKERKKKEVEIFKAKEKIREVNPAALSKASYQRNTSNLMKVLGTYPELKRG